MGYTRDRMERIVLGTMLNDFGSDGFMRSCRMSLKKEMFKSKQNAFVYDILDRMFKDGLSSTTPADVLSYSDEKGIKYGNAANFSAYMCELATENYAIVSFKKILKDMVLNYIKDVKHGSI